MEVCRRRQRGRTRYSRYAKATFRKDRRPNIRLSSKDLEAIQKRALAAGLPYQTLISSLLNLASASYGVGFLQLMTSVYPGFDASRTFGDVFVGTAYAALDGAICGLLFGWLYNAFAAGRSSSPAR